MIVRREFVLDYEQKKNGGRPNFVLICPVGSFSFVCGGHKRDEKMHPKNEVNTRRGWGKGCGCGLLRTVSRVVR